MRHILEPDRQGLCTSALHTVFPSSQSQSAPYHIGERATKEKNRGHFKEEVSLILLNLKHYLRLEVQ